MTLTLLALAVLSGIVNNMVVLARDDTSAENNEEHAGFFSKMGGALGLGAASGIAVKLGAYASVPSIMAATGEVISGVGTIHGVTVGLVQAVGAATVGTVVVTGAVVTVAGYGACKMTSYGDACDKVVGAVGDGIATGTAALGKGMWVAADAANTLVVGEHKQ
jgi:hypothetical protein